MAAAKIAIFLLKIRLQLLKPALPVSQRLFALADGFVLCGDRLPLLTLQFGAVFLDLKPLAFDRVSLCR